jgi:peptidase E
MTGYVYLLGGGEIGNNETKIIDDFILSNTKIEGNIVFIGAASADSNGYFETFKKVYGDNNTVFITAQFSRDEFSNAILKSRIVYLGGGSTELLQAQLKKWDAHKVFINALKGGTDLVGMSAGAYILSKYYIHEENDTFKVKKG